MRMFQFASDFRQEPSSLSPPKQDNNHKDCAPPISAATLQHLTSIAQEFDELANTCLLLLHLEVRVQCFHYLLAQTHYNKETHEPDPKVLELSRVLANVDEAMTSSLHPRKCKVSTYLQHYNCFLRFFFSVYIRGFGTLNSENIDQFRTVYERHR